MGGQVPPLLWHLTSCSSQGPRGGGTWPFSPRSQSPPIPLSESHCPGDLSVEGCWPDTQVELLLWDLSRHSLLLLLLLLLLLSLFSRV